jgi:hypothetical protein
MIAHLDFKWRTEFVTNLVTLKFGHKIAAKTMNFAATIFAKPALALLTQTATDSLAIYSYPSANIYERDYK